MKRKTLALFLVLAMVMTMVPTVAFAADEVMDQDELEAVIAEAYEDGGTVKLANDIETDSTINITGTVILDLNGYDIKAGGTGYSVITVGDGSTAASLTLQDSGNTGTRYITGVGSEAVISDVTSGAEVTGGVIYGGSTTLGGGVFVASGATFTMTGGTIAGNTATLGGGGVHIVGTMTMSEGTGGTTGTISNNTSATGGGVRLNGGYTFTMNAGTIKDNTATNEGGGVFFADGGDSRTFTMNGGTISGNSASSGGGVYVNAGYTMNMNGGNITGNTATTSGGGVYVACNAEWTKMNISNNSVITITGNTANGITNNMYLDYDGTYTVSQKLTVSTTPVSTSSIGITLENVTGDFTFAGARAENVFSSDKSGYEVIEDGSSTYTYSINVAPVAQVNNTKYTTVQAAIDAANGEDETNVDTVTLLTDVSITETITVTDADGVILDLAGFDIDGSGITDATKASVITVNGGALTLTDSADDEGIISGGTGTTVDETTIGGGVYVWNGGSFTMSGGIIGDNSATNGAGVYVASGTFTMTGGVIGGSAANKNTATANGGGVYVNSGVTATLSGGEISYNESTTNGGGVYVDGTNSDSKATFNMTGGTISGNTATGTDPANGGGGVFVQNYGEFTMSHSDAAIESNTANNGGGVFVNYKATFTMSDGTIGGEGAGNTSSYGSGGGGGVYVRGSNSSNYGIFTMTGGTISYNEHTNSTGGGGGVYVSDYGIFNMSNAAIIEHNTSSSSGGGVSVAGNGTMTMDSGSAITNNSASSNGGGVYMNGTMNISGTVNISGNTKGEAANNVYLLSGKTMTVTGSLSGSSIGINTYITAKDGIPVAVAVGYDDYSLSETDDMVFTKDVSSAAGTLTFVDDDATNEIQLYVAHTHTWGSYSQGTMPNPEYDADTNNEVDEFIEDPTKIVATCSGCADTATLQIAAPTGLTYTGSAIEATITDADGLQGDAVVVYYQAGALGYDTAMDGKPINVGTYKAELTVGGIKAEVEYTIEAKSITAPRYTSTSAAYTGVAHTTDFPADGDGYCVSYSFDSDTVESIAAIAEGVYTATYTLDDTTNTVWSTGGASDIAYTYTITKATTNTVSFTVAGGWTYGATAVLPEASASFGAPVLTYYATQEDATAGTNTIATPTAAGTYYVRADVTGTDNYVAGSTTASFTISPYTLTLASDSTVYDEDATFTQEIAGASDETVTVTITVDSADAGEYTTGKYTVAYEVDGATSTNYALAEAQDATFTITKAPVTVSLSNTVQTAGDVSGVSVTTDQEVTYTVTYGDTETTTVPTAVGTYAIYVTLTADPSNYYIASGDNASTEPVQMGTLIITEEAVTTYEITGIVKDSDGTTLVAGATVTLKQGDTVFATAVTDEFGAYTFTNVISGLYNIVAESDGVTMTIAETIEANGIVDTITMPSGNTNSVVEVTGATTPAVVVGGLDAVAEDEAVTDSTVKVVLSVEEKRDSDILTDSAQISEEVASDETVGMYLAIDITKTVDDGAETSITETNDVVQITIPLPEELQGKETYVVYRAHEGDIHTITTTAVDGEKIVVSSDKTSITLYVKKFSTYALAYTEYTASTGSSSGGSSSYSSSVASADNGDVSVSSSKSTSGSKITITATPDEGYEVGSVTVTYASGREVSVTDNGDGTYSYIQPGAAVTVKVTFVAIGSETDSDRPFTDVDSDDSYYNAVVWAVENGITTGYADGSFNPYGVTNRAQAVTFLWRAMDEPSYTIDNPFTDISEDDYFYDAVLWAFENGITVGTTDTTFSPYMDCSRAHIITFLWRMDGEKVTNSLNLFTDVSETNYYYDAVLWGVGEGITTGVSNTTFQPETDCNRSVIVTFLYRYLA
ncbi:S-layer homology domain-containing protein [Bengtsoniella intestinalis]|uniref:S-layer homology domain-containing protein n=1 Tax=Bengtsoniella intestinalis TaxID=3073143 RepID=UPI00391FB7F6